MEFRQNSGPELALLVCVKQVSDVSTQFVLAFGNTPLAMQEVTRLLLSWEDSPVYDGNHLYVAVFRLFPALRLKDFKL